MKKIKFYIALLMGKIAMLVQRLLGMNASYFPGKLAIKLCPDFLGQIGKPEKIIAVTGTNGKTTCCNLILSVLTANGYDVLNNKLGSNINAGIASSLISGSTMGGKCKKKLALFEVDERSSRLIYPYVKPDYVLCTNLFRDSIRRNAHTEYIFNIISDNLPKTSKMILNADDLISSRLAPGNERVYFGIEQLPTDKTESQNIVNDMRICPKCSTPLKYNYVRYHHIGNAYCPNCGFKSPKADYSASIDFENRTMTVDEKNENKVEYNLVNDSIFNIYNLLAATTLLREFGLKEEQIKETVKSVNIVESRYSNEKINGIEVITNMAKGQNSVACSCVFDYVRREPDSKEIILLLDDAFDRKESSENMTWIYDADFEYLNDPSIKRIIIGGVRTADYKLRLLIAGVDPEKIVCTESEMDTPSLLKFDSEKIFILHELYLNTEAMKVRDKVKDMLRERGGRK